MIERLHRYRPGERTPRREVPLAGGAGAPPAPTDTGEGLRGAPGEDEPSILGFPAEIDPDGQRDDVGPGRAARRAGPDPAVRMVVRRRDDLVAAAALALAGVAANVSLWLPWVAGEDQTGLFLVRRAVHVVGSGSWEVLRLGLWEPVAIVLCGGVLAVLALLLLFPAHTHRFVGVLALLVALAATAAVMTLLVGANWSTARLGPGLWSGVAVAGFGLLGALKAMLTLPRVTTVERQR